MRVTSNNWNATPISKPTPFGRPSSDGAFSGASLDRPALQQLLADVRAGEAVAGGDQSACLGI
jgi:hypothetical protein